MLRMIGAIPLLPFYVFMECIQTALKPRKHEINARHECSWNGLQIRRVEVTGRGGRRHRHLLDDINL
jgi:hypothetical protein